MLERVGDGVHARVRVRAWLRERAHSRKGTLKQEGRGHMQGRKKGNLCP